MVRNCGFQYGKLAIDFTDGNYVTWPQFVSYFTIFICKQNWNVLFQYKTGLTEFLIKQWPSLHSNLCLRRIVHQDRPIWHAEATESVWLGTLTKLSSSRLVMSQGDVPLNGACVGEMLDTLHINCNDDQQGRLFNAEQWHFPILETYFKISKTWNHVSLKFLRYNQNMWQFMPENFN